MLLNLRSAKKQTLRGQEATRAWKYRRNVMETKRRRERGGGGRRGREGEQQLTTRTTRRRKRRRAGRAEPQRWRRANARPAFHAERPGEEEGDGRGGTRRKTTTDRDREDDDDEARQQRTERTECARHLGALRGATESRSDLIFDRAVGEQVPDGLFWKDRRSQVQRTELWL